MSAPRKRYCVFGCDALFAHSVPLHQFPHPQKRPDMFAAWVSAVGDKLQESDDMKIFKNKRICDHHFETTQKVTGRRLIWSAVPTVNLNRVQQSITTIAETDHSYCRFRREPMQLVPMADITNLPGPSRISSADSTIFQKYDADKTFEYLQEKSQASCAIKVRQTQNEIRRLRAKVKDCKLRLRQKEKLQAQRDFEKLTQNMSESAKLFTRMQFKEGQKKKKGRRFSLEEKFLSLSMYKKSPKAYKLLCKHFTLPSKKILNSLLAQIKLSPGINEIIFKELKSTVSKMLPQDRLCTLIFDEMSISPQLHYNVHTDDLVGFENYGNEKTSNFASHALVFMVKGIKRKFKQPVAYYFTETLKAPKLREILIEVVSNVQSTGLKLIATICDQSSANVSMINNLISQAKSDYLQAGKEWRSDIININNQHITPLFDVPHLLKGIRNNMLNKDMQYMHENELKIIKWQFVQWVYRADKSHGELRIAPKLTDEHIDPSKIKKMRVKNAAQVLSHTMAVATDNFCARGDVPLECRDLIPFMLLIDKLFDSLNASSFLAPNGKIYRGAVKRNSPHHELWQEALRVLKTVKFILKKSDGRKIEKSVQTINNFIKTIEGFKFLWQLLSTKYSLDAMLTRNFNQDPLENFFGGIRSLGARNIAPNCMGFEGAFKTLLLNNFSSNHAINANCESDNNECLQSLSFLIKSKTNNAPSDSRSTTVDLPLDLMQNKINVSDTGSDQRTYVCGWALTKCLQKVVKGCKHCKSKLLDNSENDRNRYIRAKEYTKNKKGLCYPSDSLVACFKDIQETTISFLNNECHKTSIKERIKLFIEIFTDFSFMDCINHKQKFKQCFIDVSINIIIYSWCRSVNRILEGKISYHGDDVTKKAAQMYYNKHKNMKK